ncbi:MAG: hypothetical protein ABUL72_06180, partial [Armatimonadota bacterium]
PIVNLTSPIDLRAYSTVSTLAGSGASGSVDGPAMSATWAQPYGVAVSQSDTVYVTDASGYNTVRSIANGQTSLLAGGGTAGTNGFGATAGFNGPHGLAVNPVDGTVIVAESGGNRIRRSASNGQVSTIAGTGAATSTTGSGASATLNAPEAVAVSPSGVIYVTEFGGRFIDAITFSGGDPTVPANYVLTHLSGTGAGGSADGSGATATWGSPRGICYGIDSALYVADSGINKIRRVDPKTGSTATIAGTGVAAETNGTGATAAFKTPYGIAAVNGALVVSDQGANTLRQLLLRTGASTSSPTSWNVASLAGNGTTASIDGPGTGAAFNVPSLIAASPSTGIIVADKSGHQVRKVTSTTSAFPVGNPGGAASTSVVALSNPDGYTDFTGEGNHLPFKRYSETIDVNAVSSSQKWSFSVPSDVAAFTFTVSVLADVPVAATLDSANGIGSKNVRVRTLAGGGSNLGLVDGPATIARFNGPDYPAVDKNGVIYSVDQYNLSIRRVDLDGNTSTIAGSLSAGFVDGYGSNARFSYPSGCAVNRDGTVLYICDTVNNAIRRMTYVGGDPTNAANWYVATIIGTGTAGGNYTSPTAGNVATLNAPVGIALDSTEKTLYFTETSGNRVRRASLTGGDPAVAANWRVYLIDGDA